MTFSDKVSVIKSPCMRCKERCAGCHGACKKYKQYKKENKITSIMVDKKKKMMYNA